MEYTFRPKGVCARQMNVEVEDGKVKKVEVIGGCSGNLQGISRLVEGMEVNEAIRRMQGIHCGMKDTSCPDQLSIALKEAMAANA